MTDIFSANLLQKNIWTICYVKIFGQFVAGAYSANLLRTNYYLLVGENVRSRIIFQEEHLLKTSFKCAVKITCEKYINTPTSENNKLADFCSLTASTYQNEGLKIEVLIILGILDSTENVK